MPKIMVDALRPRRDQRSDQAKLYRHLYNTPRWKRLRLRVFERDLFICQQTGVLLVGRHPADNSPVAHHVKEHKGDPVLFFDETNIITVSKAWHDAVAQSEEKLGYLKGCDENGRPLDPAHPWSGGG